MEVSESSNGQEISVAGQIEFIRHCMLDRSLPGTAIIATMAQFISLTRKYLHERQDPDSCVNFLDILESQVAAMRQCVVDLEVGRNRIVNSLKEGHKH